MDDEEDVGPDAVWWLAIAAIYGPVAVCASGWLWWTGSPTVADPGQFGLGAMVGAGIGGAMGILARVPVIRSLETGLSEVFAGIGAHTIVGLALASAVAEELVFRGILLPWWGLVPSSALFAVAHIPHRPSMWAWPLFAFAMGLVLGELTLRAGGDLGAAIAAHFAVNLLGLLRLVERATPP